LCIHRAPDQVRVVTLNDDEALINHAQPIVAALRANMLRVAADFSATPFKAKISNSEQLRVHTLLVIGGRDLAAGQVSRLAKSSQYPQLIRKAKTLHHFTPQLTRRFDSLHPLHF
jgi:threonyl-tRNA synthetase